jgi:hypothetical protein
MKRKAVMREAHIIIEAAHREMMAAHQVSLKLLRERDDARRERDAYRARVRVLEEELAMRTPVVVRSVDERLADIEQALRAQPQAVQSARWVQPESTATWTAPPEGTNPWVGVRFVQLASPEFER